MRNPKEKTSDWFSAIFYEKMFFDYFIIFLPLFDFQRGYGTTERSEFILTEVNG